MCVSANGRVSVRGCVYGYYSCVRKCADWGDVMHMAVRLLEMGLLSADIGE